MDNLVEKYVSNASRSSLFSTVLKNTQGAARRLIGFFTLTKEDQLKAGIYLGGEGRDSETGYLKKE
jgi:hypothetical protein